MGEARTQRLSTVEPHTDHALAPEERPQLKAELDEVQRRFKIAYRYCLYALILLVTGFAVVLFRAFADTDDVNRAFLDLYGGVAYVAFLAWAIGKLRALRPRPSDLPDVRASFGRDKDTGAWEVSFRLGAPELGAGPGPRGPTLHPPPETGASSLGADAAGPHTTDREARALEARASSAGFWIVLGAAALALLLALWTLGWIPAEAG